MSTETLNYHLKQWESSDKPIMADFNSDNAKIDAALSSLNENTWNKDNLVIESGVWTPTIYGGTTAGNPVYSERTGLYFRNGKIIDVSFVIVLSSAGNMAGTLYVSGIPFPMLNFISGSVNIVINIYRTSPGDSMPAVNMASDGRVFFRWNADALIDSGSVNANSRINASVRYSIL